MFETMLTSIALAVSLDVQPQAPQLQQAHAGDCAVTVALAGQRNGDVVQVLLDFGRLADRVVTDAAQPNVEVPTGSPLQKGQRLRLLINGSEVANGQVTDPPAGRTPAGVCVQPLEAAFEGESFEASAYFGWAFDQFAPDSVGGYPPGTATSKHNRMLFGVDFDYRAFGNDSGNVQLWLQGETLHGVRAADIDCSAETNKPPVCTPAPGITYTRAVLENATSLEAYAQPRLEFATLQAGSSTPTKLYVTARFGFIALDEAPRVFKNHHVGIGLLADDGPFAGSTLEVAWGMNEMLSGRQWNRFKLDGLLTFSLDGIPGIRDKGSFFIEMFIDNDLQGPTADSVQTFLGMDLDIRKFFGGR
jgi:hypothetical protein